MEPNIDGLLLVGGHDIHDENLENWDLKELFEDDRIVELVIECIVV
jgi:hypothetical protein